MAPGKPVFLVPMFSSIILCLSAVGLTSIAIVKGASRLLAEPVIAPGDACGLTFPPANGLRVRLPDAP